jgi:hypothetical protein
VNRGELGRSLTTIAGRSYAEVASHQQRNILHRAEPPEQPDLPGMIQIVRRSAAD